MYYLVCLQAGSGLFAGCQADPALSRRLIQLRVDDRMSQAATYKSIRPSIRDFARLTA